MSCSPTCSRMYRWQKQQGRSRASPQHSQPHERMMLDYLQEMSRAGPAGRRSQRRRAEPSRAESMRKSRRLGKERMRGNPSFPLIVGEASIFCSSSCLKRVQEIRPHAREQTTLAHYVLFESFSLKIIRCDSTSSGLFSRFICTSFTCQGKTRLSSMPVSFLMR